MNNQAPTIQRKESKTRNTTELHATRGEIGRAALIAGFGLLAMAIIAGLANFGAVEAVVVDGDAAATAQNLAESRTTFLLGVVGFGLVAVLDVIIAWALHVFFRPSSPRTSALAAVVRIVYGGFLAVATIQLAGALNANTDAQTLRSIESFQDTWNAGLVLFGAHLLLISWLVWKTVRVPNWVGLFVAITGVGYVIDAIGTLSSETYSADITTITFIGEVVLMFWLLIKGRSTGQA